MASFGVSTAGLVNTTAPAAAIHRAAHVSAGVVTGVRFTGNVFSLLTLLVPLYSYVRPVYRDKGVGDRTVYSFIGVFFGAMLWLLVAIPSRHRDAVTMAVNCAAILVETGYILFYLKYAVDENYDCSWRIVAVCAVIAGGVSFFIVFVVILTRVWSVKVVGISAATFGTIMFIVGIIDVVMLVKNQRSAFSILLLLANLGGACTWTSFAFLFDPANLYIAVPNITGVAVILVQIVFHAVAVRKWKDRRDPPPAANRA